ncbi:hypothetical protein B0T21DRAFT_348426 [Apiosordaria backusii]|uniref:Uncharacterized protein n=1 Tax=Apiosordaria backusii TaxID=314023 RepID=A0AA40BLF5_9PEZI|nr:hypothetical protein B0T21DRAFT_348426 [Apiosordaria backusii]
MPRPVFSNHFIVKTMHLFSTEGALGEITLSDGKSCRLEATGSYVLLINEVDKKKPRSYLIPDGSGAFSVILSDEFIRWDEVSKVTMEFGTDDPVIHDVYIYQDNIAPYGPIDPPPAPSSCSYIGPDYIWSSSAGTWGVQETSGYRNYLATKGDPPKYLLKSGDVDEVAGFNLMSVRETGEAMFRGEFRASCSLFMIDFFIRDGIITKENKEYNELTMRLHRLLPVPLDAESNHGSGRTPLSWAAERGTSR